MKSTTTSSSTSSNNNSNDKAPYRIGIIGGGASGMFAAVSAASSLRQQLLLRVPNNHHTSNKNNLDNNKNYEIKVLEATSSTLKKVKISGGGRCNVLHDTSKPVSTILNGYPRGKKELNGLLHKHFSPSDARKWFEDRGVVLKTESDGRMFPITDSSQTIIDAIVDCAKEYGVEICMNQKVLSIQKEITRDEKEEDTNNHQNSEKDSFIVTTSCKDSTTQTKTTIEQSYDAIILATGSTKIGYDLATQLGHSINPLVPSLFTLNTKHLLQEGQTFHGLAGISVPEARITLKVPADENTSSSSNSSSNTNEGATGGGGGGKKKKKKKKEYTQEGPILISHHGVTGPAVLRLSAFAAHEFHCINYQTAAPNEMTLPDSTTVTIHWMPNYGTTQDIESYLWSLTTSSPKRTIASICPMLLPQSSNTYIPKRLWSSLVVSTDGLDKSTLYGQVSKKKIGALARTIAEFPLQVTGKGIFKEEFVTAGGVNLKEITMKTMESKVCSGLFVCGELINVDGITGGFNFMNCWSTGYVSGTNAVSRILDMEMQGRDENVLDDVIV